MKCKINFPKCGLILAGVLASIFFLVSYDNYYFPVNEHHHYIYINMSKAVAETDEEFLSVSLDTSFMKRSFHKLNSSDWEILVNMSKLMAPAYLRLGGTAADQVLFNFHGKDYDYPEYYESADSAEHGTYVVEEISPTDYLNISGHDWIKFFNFVNESGLRLILDLNVLLRNGSKWDSQNAQQLLKFADSHDMDMDFQLGNEPNSFKHVFNISIPGEQLGEDFNSLREILSSWKRFSASKIIGPDVTRPKFLDSSSIHYLKEFLSTARDLDAVSWHQYYLNGRTATLHDFLNPNTLDILTKQIEAIENVVRQFVPNTSIWLSETSSAYGGGAPGLSDTFAATYLWLDKLGLASKMGVKVVIRQTLFQGYYSLIDDDLRPLPDFWISLFYKLLAGRKVFSIRFPKQKDENHLRFYANCLKKNEKISGSIILFGLNMKNTSEYIVPGGLRSRFQVTPLIFTSEHGNLTSKTILLNGRKLQFGRLNQILESAFNSKSQNLPLHMPPYSLVFWIFHGDNDKENVCQDE